MAPFGTVKLRSSSTAASSKANDTWLNSTAAGIGTGAIGPGSGEGPISTTSRPAGAKVITLVTFARLWPIKSTKSFLRFFAKIGLIGS